MKAVRFIHLDNHIVIMLVLSILITLMGMIKSILTKIKVVELLEMKALAICK